MHISEICEKHVFDAVAQENSSRVTQDLVFCIRFPFSDQL